MHVAFSQTDHRPWALPEHRWTWRQSWLDLLFMHWPVPAEELGRFVPPSLQVQEFDGTSWIGVVPFRMAGVMRRPLPDLPWVSAFPELNVRIYVEAEGKPGVWFLSLDAANPLAVWAARRFFHLPYYHAQMALTYEGDAINYTSKRYKDDATFRCRYRPVGDVYLAEPGTLEHWLTERYCLYTQRPNGPLVRNDIHHIPWPLQKAEAEVIENTVLPMHGINHSGAPLLHFARSIHVVVWNAERVGGD